MESEAARLQNNPQVDFTPLEEPPVCLIPALAHFLLLMESRFTQQLPPQNHFSPFSHQHLAPRLYASHPPPSSGTQIGRHLIPPMAMCLRGK